MADNGGFNAEAFLAGLRIAVMEDNDDSVLTFAERIGGWIGSAGPEQIREMIEAFDECLKDIVREADERAPYFSVALVTLRAVLYGRLARLLEGPTG